MKIVLIDEDGKKLGEYEGLEMAIKARPGFENPIIRGDDLVRMIHGDLEYIEIMVKGNLGLINEK